jgi:hypothetical protein
VFSPVLANFDLGMRPIRHCLSQSLPPILGLPVRRLWK